NGERNRVAGVAGLLLRRHVPGKVSAAVSTRTGHFEIAEGKRAVTGALDCEGEGAAGSRKASAYSAVSALGPACFAGVKVMAKTSAAILVSRTTHGERTNFSRGAHQGNSDRAVEAEGVKDVPGQQAAHREGGCVSGNRKGHFAARPTRTARQIGRAVCTFEIPALCQWRGARPERSHTQHHNQRKPYS